MVDNRLVHLPSLVELVRERGYVKYVGKPHSCKGLRNTLQAVIQMFRNMAMGQLCAPEGTNACDAGFRGTVRKDVFGEPIWDGTLIQSQDHLEPCIQNQLPQVWLGRA